MMDAENMQAEEKLSDSCVDAEAKKVMAYLIECGLDPSTVSVSDIDGKSLDFLAEWAAKNSNSNILEVNSDLVYDQGQGNEGIVIESREPKAKDMTTEDPARGHSTHDVNSTMDALTAKHLEIQRLKLMSASLQALRTASASSKKAKTKPKTEVNLDDMEPWQKALFENMDAQTKAIERCQAQLEALANIVALNMMADSENRLERRSNTSSTTTNSSQSLHDTRGVPSFSQADLNARLRQVDPPQEERNGQANPVPAGLPLLDRILFIPREAYKYITTTRPVRIFVALRQEADNFHIPGNRNQRLFDVQLMFKLSFICMFLRARMGSNVEKRGFGRKLQAGDFWGEMVALWRYHSSSMLLISSVIVYFIQTGLFVFFYKVLIKDNLIGRILRNEDLEEGTDRDRDGGHDEEGRVVNGARRGRRDRAPVRNNEAAHAIGNDAPQEANRREGHGNQAIQGRIIGMQETINAQINIGDTFIAGVMDGPLDRNEEQVRNIPREEIFLRQMIEGFKDVVYLFGSFLLSIFPMWRPRAREVVVEDNRVQDYGDERDGRDHDDANGNDDRSETGGDQGEEED